MSGLQWDFKGTAEEFKLDFKGEYSITYKRYNMMVPPESQGKVPQGDYLKLWLWPL